MKHYAPQPTHIVAAIPAVTKRQLLQDRPAKVTALSAALRAVKAQIAALKA